jgi:hypothetical protein
LPARVTERGPAVWGAGRPRPGRSTATTGSGKPPHSPLADPECPVNEIPVGEGRGADGVEAEGLATTLRVELQLPDGRR